MIEWMFQVISFLASNAGLLITGAVCGLVILLWDWRFGLLGVCFIQLSAATAGVVLHGIAAEWAMIQTVVVVLVCLMMLLSARAHGLHPSIRQPGTGVARGLLLGMFLAGAWFMDVQVTLPGMDALVMELFVWLVLCAVMLLGLSDHPLYNGIGLLLWLIPVQVIVAVVMPIPVVVALVGLVVLVVGMAVSYLVFVEHLQAEDRGPVLTDLAFPQQLRLEGAPSREPSGPGNGWLDRVLPGQRPQVGTDAPPDALPGAAARIEDVDATRSPEQGKRLTARRRQ